MGPARIFGDWRRPTTERGAADGSSAPPLGAPESLPENQSPPVPPGGVPEELAPAPELSLSPSGAPEPASPSRSGVLTFLMTDIEGSTRLWAEQPAAMRGAMDRHDEIIQATVTQNEGQVIGERGEGDSRFCIFKQATGAVRAAAALQEQFFQAEWPEGIQVRVRAAVHTGEAEDAPGGLYGSAINRCARIRALAAGGQTVISEATRTLVAEGLPERVTLKDLGVHRLRDLQRPERIYQLVIDGLPAQFPPLKSLDALPHNLPVQLTSFIGREREIEQVKAALRERRLVTLTGPGGCGKTRLALEVAAGVSDEFEDGVWLVELASLSDPLLVPRAVAAVLNIREERGRPLRQTLATALCQHSLLLLLDNCEHLIDACSAMADGLLAACPRVRVLATSREMLGLAGEFSFRVPSLALPQPSQLAAAEQNEDALRQVMGCEAVRLFVERALTARPEFRPSRVRVIAQVCEQLDGIPLAIELAAARTRVMTVEQIAAGLDDRFRLLTGGSRVALPRQQTLRALLDWSYDLLMEPEKVFLARLSVFIGGASLEAIAGICSCRPGEGYDVLDALTRLVDKSLVIAEEHDGVMRYSMLETIRQYARERLAASGESEPLRSCHRDYFLALAEEAEPKLHGAAQAEWLNRLETERDNLLAAIEWSLARCDLEASVRLGAALWPFWEIRGYWTEGRERLDKILALPGAAEHGRLYARLLIGAGTLGFHQGDYAVARKHLEAITGREQAGEGRRELAHALYVSGSIAQARGDSLSAEALFAQGLDAARAVGDSFLIAGGLLCLGNGKLNQCDYPQARAFFQESLVAFRQVGDKRNIAKVVGNLGLMAYEEGDYSSASPLYEEALAIRRELGDKAGIATQLDNLGYATLHQGEYGRARAEFQESLTIFGEIKSKRGIADVLCGLAALAAAQGEAERAARLLGAGGALYAALGFQVDAANQAEYVRAAAPARTQLGEARYDALCAEGAKMSAEQATAYALCG